MNSPLLPTIFISYSHADRSLVDDIAKQLRMAYSNYDCTWYDVDIAGGQRWWPKILQEIELRALFLFVMSNEAITSEYCQKELEHAFRLNKIIIPIVGRTGTIKPDYLDEFQHVDMSTSRVTLDNFGLLQKAICEHVSIWSVSDLPSSARFQTHFSSQPLNSEPTVSKEQTHRSRFSLIEAGPGTGKTTTLIEKVKSLLRNDVDPTRIMLVTFTLRLPQILSENLNMKKYGILTKYGVAHFTHFASVL